MDYDTVIQKINKNKVFLTNMKPIWNERTSEQSSARAGWLFLISASRLKLKQYVAIFSRSNMPDHKTFRIFDLINDVSLFIGRHA